VAGHEQSCGSDLPHDRLACRQRGAEAAGLAADLAGSRDGGVDPAEGEAWRPAIFCDAAIQASLSFPGRFGLPLRPGERRGAPGPRPPATGLVASLSRRAKLAGAGLQHFGPAPEEPDGHDPLPRQQGRGSHLLIDSPGIKALGEGGGSPQAWRLAATSVVPGSPGP
jgi:hypothetical protein